MSHLWRTQRSHSPELARVTEVVGYSLLTLEGRQQEAGASGIPLPSSLVSLAQRLHTHLLGDNVALFICELFLCHLLSWNILKLIPLELEEGKERPRLVRGILLVRTDEET